MNFVGKLAANGRQVDVRGHKLGSARDVVREEASAAICPL